MDLSPMHILLLLAVVVLLFGGRKIPEVMRGLGQGIKEFKQGMRNEDTPNSTPPPNPAPSQAQASADKK